MIVVGDLHIKRKEPYFSAITSFLYWLIGKYNNETILFLGDLYDSSSPHGDIEEFIASWLKQFKEVHIITGNHDYSKKSGNALLQLRQHPNISVYTDITEIIIEEKKCLLLPFKYGNIKEEYESLTGTYDYIFTHITPLECAFKDEGIQLNLRGTYIHGHTHMQKFFVDDIGNNHHVLGVPIPTRHLEEQQPHAVMSISKDGSHDSILVPQTFTYETIEFGDEPENKNNILNILNAPSMNNVYESYKGYFIREEGVTIKIDDTDCDIEETININDDIKSVFMDYSKEKALPKEIVNCCLEFL